MCKVGISLLILLLKILLVGDGFGTRPFRFARARVGGWGLRQLADALPSTFGTQAVPVLSSLQNSAVAGPGPKATS